MSNVPITITILGGGDPVTETKSLTITSGILMPIKVAEWAKDARAFILSVPTNTVVVPPELRAAVREADSDEQRAIDAGNANEWTAACGRARDARLALADHVMQAMEGGE